MTRRSHWPIVILSTISTVFGILLPLVLVRVLPPAEVGHFKIFFLYLTILPAFSLTTGIMNGLAFWVGQGEKAERNLKMSSTLILGLAIISVSLILVFRSSIAVAFSWTDEQSYLFAFSLLGAIAGSFFEEAAIATGKIWTGALVYSGFELLRAGAILAALLLFKDLTAILWAHTIVVTTKLIFGYVYGYRLKLVGFIFDPSSIKAVWRYAFPVSLAWVFGIFLGSADQFVLAGTISSAQFAIYSIGCLTIAPLLIFEHSITRVIIPQMSEAFSQRQPSRAAILYQGAVENLGFMLIPAVVGLIVFSTPIIEICFTRQYAEAAQYLRLYALTYLFLIIPYDALPRAKGQSDWILRTFVVFALLALSLAYLLARLYGPMGALSAILISGAAMRIYAIIYFQSQTGLRLRKFLPVGSCFQYTLLSVVLGGWALLMRDKFSEGHLWFIVCGSIFALLYLGIALPIKNRSERIRQPARGVLILTQSLNIGGLERMVLFLCENLQSQKRWIINVLAYDQKPEPANSGSGTLLAEFKAREIPVEAFKKPGRFSILVVARILRSIYRNDIQILHSQDLGSLMYATLAKLCCFGRVAIVHTQHSFIHLDRAKRYRLYEKFLTRFVDKLSVVSEDTKKTYLDMGIHQSKIHLIENGVAFPKLPIVAREQRLAAREALLNQCPAMQQAGLKGYLTDHWILYLARFFPGKGQDHALGLWGELDPELRCRSVLCFVGPQSADGEYDRINALIEKSPDKERIFMLGASSQPQRWLSAGDVYLSCSEFEGMPLGPLEALGTGLPSVVSNIAGHEFIKPMSIQYNFSDYKDGAQRIEDILSQINKDGDSFFAQAWDRGGALRERYSIERMSRKYSLLYADSIAADASSRYFLEESLREKSFG